MKTKLVAILCLSLAIFANGQSTVIEAESGEFHGPFLIKDGCLSQSSPSGSDAGGRADYSFNISVPGEYAVIAILDASGAEHSSLTIAIDNQPEFTNVQWQVAPTKGFENRLLEWPDAKQLHQFERRRSFYLGTGSHHLSVQRITGNIRIKKFIIGLPPAPVENFHIVQDFSDRFPQLSHKDEKVRNTAIFYLNSVDLQDNLPSLAAALTNTYVTVRRFAAEALSKQGTRAYEVADSLVHALKDSDAQVRAQAALSLGNIGTSAAFAVPNLIPLLQDEELVQINAIAALGSIRKYAENTFPAVAERLRSGSPAVKLSAIRTLGQLAISPQETVPLLISSMRIGDRRQRVAISESLAAIAATAMDSDAHEAREVLTTAHNNIPRSADTADSLKTVERSVKYLSKLSDSTTPLTVPYQRISLLDLKQAYDGF